ncbi:MAG: indolepyruvate oxidoreductase subunit beta [Candidatus Lokiarchaeota archaeon]|nr:indolepyruvate oxidoreductase subunit beta [Candidatus Lokiarchaeota archaeon]
MHNSHGYNILTVGVGGTGVISATQILAWAALEDNYQVRTAETHGMAQRGGSVVGYLRFGSNVKGPLIYKADVILSFELSEILRYSEYINEKTSLFVSKDILIPPSVYTYNIPYPSQDVILNHLRKITHHVHLIDAGKMAKNAGNPKTSNVVLIGTIYGAGKLPIQESSLKNAIIKFVPDRAKKINEIAFQIGIQYGRKIKEGFYE